ncbi:MAG: hypothetical protein ACLQO7_00525 [Candidatus Bathyarchaeia archaeon]
MKIAVVSLYPAHTYCKGNAQVCLCINLHFGAFTLGSINQKGPLAFIQQQPITSYESRYVREVISFQNHIYPKLKILPIKRIRRQRNTAHKSVWYTLANLLKNLNRLAPPHDPTTQIVE